MLLLLRLWITDGSTFAKVAQQAKGRHQIRAQGGASEPKLPSESFHFGSWQVLHEPLIDEDPVFIATCTERELRKRKKRKFSLWVRQCSSTGFIVQVSPGARGAEGRGPGLS